MADSIIGAPLSKDVHDQILMRESKARSPQRDNNTLFFLNSNKCWIKLSSGVDTIPEFGDTIGDSTLAKQNILGPTLNKAGVGSLYNLTNSRGYRPIPGITEVKVKSKGTYGALRETEVMFPVWSLEDLDVMESIYLRPGFSMLLEWGHTCYFNNAGEFLSASSTINDFFSRYVTTGDKSTQQVIQDKIQALRVSTGYNYDGLFGYVKNFSWSFRKDGGYDCSISIASAGSLIEGLRADIGIQNIPQEIQDREAIDQLKDSIKSPFHFIFEQLEDKLPPLGADAPGDRKSLITLKNDENKPISVFFNKLKLPDETYVYNRMVTSFGFAYISAYAKPTYWMHLSMVFEIINTYMTLRNKNGKTVEIYSGAQDSVTTGAYEITSKYITSKYHFSVDPYRVHLPFACEVPSGIEDIPEDVKIYLGKVPISAAGYVQAVNGGLLSNLFTPTRGDVDDILNITVSSFVLRELFDRNLEEPDTQNRDLKTILDNLASILTDHLGGINEFAFHYDESRNLFILVDRKNTPTDASTSKYPQITLTGLSSLVSNINLSSKLSNKVATQIAIAAQGSNDKYQENVSDILQWNSGLVDRHSVGGTYNVGDSTTPDSTEAEQYARRVQWMELAAGAYEWNGSGNTYEASAFNELKPYHAIYTSDYALSLRQYLGEAEKGIIPVELSFTTMGISGIDIAESFKIAKGILPTRYNDKFGFIVTGLEHSIGSNWTTTIKTQFYILQPPSDQQKAAVFARLNSGKPAGWVSRYTGATSGGGGGGGGGGGTPPPLFTGATPNADYLRGVIATLGYVDTGRLSETMDLTYEMSRYAAQLFQLIKQKYPDISIRVSGGADAWHFRKYPNSRHSKGRAVDFTFTPFSQGMLSNINLILQDFMWANNLKASYLDEYTSPSSGSTAPHYHISWLVDGEIENPVYYKIKKKGPPPSVLNGLYFVR